MTSPAIILTDFRCRHCRRAIPLSFTSPMRWIRREGGFLCEACIVREQENMRRLQVQAADFATRYVDLDGVAPPCAICDTIEGEERVLEDYEGAKALMCKPCAAAYLLANRAKLAGTKLEYDLKLR